MVRIDLENCVGFVYRTLGLTDDKYVEPPDKDGLIQKFEYTDSMGADALVIFRKDRSKEVGHMALVVGSGRSRRLVYVEGLGGEPEEVDLRTLVRRSGYGGRNREDREIAENMSWIRRRGND